MIMEPYLIILFHSITCIVYISIYAEAILLDIYSVISKIITKKL